MQAVEAAGSRPIHVARRDGTSIVLQDVVVQRDSVIGRQQGASEVERTAVALPDVASISTYESNGGETVRNVVLVAAGLLVLYVLALGQISR